jgi:hypothetical protein
MGPRQGCPTGATRGLDGVPDGGARRGQRGGRTGCQTGPDRGRTGCPTGATRGPHGGREGGGRKDYLLLKDKLTCSVYVSCKSSSASDVSDAGWI